MEVRHWSTTHTQPLEMGRVFACTLGSFLRLAALLTLLLQLPHASADEEATANLYKAVQADDPARIEAGSSLLAQTLMNFLRRSFLAGKHH